MTERVLRFLLLWSRAWSRLLGGLYHGQDVEGVSGGGEGEGNAMRAVRFRGCGGAVARERGDGQRDRSHRDRRLRQRGRVHRSGHHGAWHHRRADHGGLLRLLVGQEGHALGQQDRLSCGPLPSPVRAWVGRLQPLDRGPRFRGFLLLGVLLIANAGVSGSEPTVETFSSAASSTWVCPEGVTEVQVEVWGGGGGGGGRDNAEGYWGGGGGGGAYSMAVVSVTPGTSYSYVVGAGGAGGAQDAHGSHGSDSWFGSTSTVLAKAGQRGLVGLNGNGTGGSSAGSVGTVKYGGGAGANNGNVGSSGGGSSAGTGSAGASVFGATGGTAPTGGGNGGNGGSVGSSPGGGGGGNTGSGTGFAGAAGQLRLTYTEPEGEDPPEDPPEEEPPETELEALIEISAQLEALNSLAVRVEFLVHAAAFSLGMMLGFMSWSAVLTAWKERDF